MLTGQATVETAVEAMKLGAYDYLTKPYSITELDVRVKQALGFDRDYWLRAAKLLRLPQNGSRSAVTRA